MYYKKNSPNKNPLRAISGIIHAHYSCRRKRGKRFQIRLRQMDISAFCGQNKVTKMCRNIY